MKAVVDMSRLFHYGNETFVCINPLIPSLSSLGCISVVCFVSLLLCPLFTCLFFVLLVASDLIDVDFV